VKSSRCRKNANDKLCTERDAVKRPTSGDGDWQTKLNVKTDPGPAMPSTGRAARLYLVGETERRVPL